MCYTFGIATERSQLYYTFTNSGRYLTFCIPLSLSYQFVERFPWVLTEKDRHNALQRAHRLFNAVFDIGRPFVKEGNRFIVMLSCFSIIGVSQNGTYAL